MHLRDELEDAARDVQGWPYARHPSADVDASAIVFPGAYIGPNVTIGPDCVIGPGASIGAPGFGYEKILVECSCDLDGCLCLDWESECATQQYRSHTAGVVLEANVHVGGNSNIAQGRWRPTTIREGARIDALTHVAHNVIVGRNAMIVAHAELSGSVEVGDGAWVGPHACVRQGLKIGAGAVVGMAACVVKDVPAHEVWAGVPARKMGPKSEPECCGVQVDGIPCRDCPGRKR